MADERDREGGLPKPHGREWRRATPRTFALGPPWHTEPPAEPGREQLANDVVHRRGRANLPRSRSLRSVHRGRALEACPVCGRASPAPSLYLGRLHTHLALLPA